MRFPYGIARFSTIADLAADRMMELLDRRGGIQKVATLAQETAGSDRLQAHLRSG